MPALASKLSPRSEDFKANAAAMRALVDDLNAKLAKIGQGGGEAPRARCLARAASPPPCTTAASFAFWSSTSARIAAALALKSSERGVSFEAMAGMVCLWFSGRGRFALGGAASC